MDRSYYLGLAQAGLRMPIGTDLVLQESDSAHAALHDGALLGRVVVEAANRFQTPVAVPLMDLTVEKEAIFSALGLPADRVSAAHFDAVPTADERQRIADSLSGPLTSRIRANLDAIRFVAENTELLPTGMTIGPFSLMTKLIADPIGPVYIAGTGVQADEDDEVAAVEAALAVAESIILESIRRQAEAGAKLVIVCEPAANQVYFSPNQLAAGSDVFERYVLEPNRRVRDRIQALGADLFFHDCGELLDSMVSAFGELRPVILSLGSSRKLWCDAARVPKDVVLYGNLPSKSFYSDTLTPLESVRASARSLKQKMLEAEHPFILGSECDVLSVPGSHDTIVGKVEAMLGY